MVTWSELASTGGGRPVDSASTPLLDETLKCLAEVIGASSSAVFTLGARRAMFGSAGESLDAIGLQVSSRNASDAEALWIADASKPNGVVRSARPMSVAILPLAASAEGHPTILLVARKAAEEWGADVRRSIEAFAALIRSEMLDVDAERRRAMARDVTEQMRVEEESARLAGELAQEHARLHDTIANVPGVVWEELLDGSYRYVSDYVQTMLGYEPGEYLRDVASFMDLVHEDDCEMVQESTQAQIASRRGGSHAFRMRRKDGRVIWCESHCSIILGRDGEPIGIRGVSMDITDRKAAEEHLRASEAGFRQLADATPVMIWTTTASGEAEFQNRRLLAFVGAPLVGAGWIEFIHPDDRDRVVATVREAHEQQKNFQMELRMRRNDGEYRELFAEGGPRYGGSGTFEGFVGSAIDLTDRRRLERLLDEDRRLSSLGRLAATIAHEMNNVLMAIQPFAEVIRKNRTADALDRAAGHIENAVQRGARITHEILRFANSSAPVLMPVDPLACLGAHHHELAAILGPGVNLVVDVDPSIRLLADPHLMQQVFVNLASNARDAMRGAGTFTIRAALQGDPAHRVAHFTVSDTGSGVPPNIAEKVFEPLFTTKKSGTGLGLSIARDIVKKHGGTLTIDTSIPSGTLFHIMLPATDQEPVVQAQAADTLPPSVRRVLLVEDDAPVAAGIAMLLEVEGAEVRVVDRGALALDAIDSFGPDLVILDIGLPDGPGTLVFDGIRRRHPKLPVLFSTGHAGELEGKVAHLEGPTGYLLKPYDFAAVIDAIRRLI